MMNSIDNLREYALTAPSICSTTRAILVGYVDGIEREVADNERFRAEAEPFADRLREAVGERADVTLFGVDYTALPEDADGVAIHVGERVQIIGNDPSTVSHMSLADDGWRVYVKYDGDLGTGSGQPSRIRHHHAPTVEDVLQEMLYKAHIYDRREMELLPDLIAEYAAKLRLAGEE